ncbi:MAG: hypothetical protein M1829_003198 [Trizodia sp. TS-e1964]|nr:MAG: hypothetical protein M1829_003198 [Trizodia sp. TS-e1964]
MACSISSPEPQHPSIGTAQLRSPVRVYDVADDCDPTNAVRAGYLFLEKLPGRPATWYNATERQKETFLWHLAAKDIYIGLQQLPLDMIGRLHMAPGLALPKVGPAFFKYSTAGEAEPLRPFKHTSDYYKARIEHCINLLQNGEITAPDPVDAYLVYMTLLSNLPTNDSNPRYLNHLDSRDANFLVDDEYNITGVIDWESAIVSPNYSAFQSPLLLFDLVEVYQRGLSTPSLEEAKFAGILKENGHEGLAKLASQKLGFRLEQCIMEDPYSPHFIPLFSGWWKIVQSPKEFEFESWRAAAFKKYGDGGLTGKLNV